MFLALLNAFHAKCLLYKPKSLFFGVEMPISLLLSDSFQYLPYHRPRLKIEALHQFVGLNESRRENALTFADIACQQETNSSQMAFPVLS